MENHIASNRIHPLMAVAAASLTLVSLVGAAAIAGLLPNSHGAPSVVTTPVAVDSARVSPTLVKPALASAPDVKQVVEYKTVVHHDYPRHHAGTYNHRTVQTAQAEPRREYAQAPAYQQAAPVAQNSPVGIGLGALVGGLVGSQVGGGNGRVLAEIAGAVGGGYLGNEIAKRNP